MLRIDFILSCCRQDVCELCDVTHGPKGVSAKLFYRRNQYPSLGKYRQASFKKESRSAVFGAKVTCELDNTSGY